MVEQGAKPARRMHGKGEKPLTREDWMQAGQALLCQGGIAGMRLSRLTEKLGVSTGSFYHHFEDMEDFLGALANYYSTDQLETLIAMVVADTSDPLRQIRLIGSESRRGGLCALDAAMRVWASSDPRAASSLRRSERLVMKFLTDAFQRLGFDAEQGALRARMLLSVNIADFAGMSKLEALLFQEQALGLLLRDAPN